MAKIGIIKKGKKVEIEVPDLPGCTWGGSFQSVHLMNDKGIIFATISQGVDFWLGSMMLPFGIEAKDALVAMATVATAIQSV